MRKRSALLVILAILHPAARGAETDEDVLQEALLKHRAALDAIQTLTCTLVVHDESTSGNVLKTGCQYWRRGDMIRAKWRKEGVATEILIREMRVVRLGTAIGPDGLAKPMVGIEHDRGIALGLADPWITGLFCFLGEAGGSIEPMSFEQLATRFRARKTVKIHEGGQNAIIVELLVGNSTREYSFDARHNYLVSKVISTFPKGSAISEVKSFYEGSPGVFFPKEVLVKTFVDGHVQATRTATFSDIKINTAIPDQVFQVELPGNAEVHDLIAGKKYITDATGRPAGPRTDLGLPPPPGKGPVQARAPTTSEPIQWTTWVLPGSLVILLIAGARWSIRRLRQRQERAKAAL